MRVILDQNLGEIREHQYPSILAALRQAAAQYMPAQISTGK
jgi:hypothetical protein